MTGVYRAIKLELSPSVRCQAFARGGSQQTFWRNVRDIPPQQRTQIHRSRRRKYPSLILYTSAKGPQPPSMLRGGRLPFRIGKLTFMTTRLVGHLLPERSEIVDDHL